MGWYLFKLTSETEIDKFGIGVVDHQLIDNSDGISWNLYWYYNRPLLICDLQNWIDPMSALDSVEMCCQHTPLKLTGSSS